jgi:hypothetical protein
VSLACSTFRDNAVVSFPYGGTSLDPSPLYATHSNTHSASSYSLPRVETIVDLFKIIYVLKASTNSSSTSALVASDSFPKSSAFGHLQALSFLPLPIVDYALHVLLLEILLFPQLTSQPIYDLQLHALQLFSVMPPEPLTFTLILQQIYVPTPPSPSEEAPHPPSALSAEAMRMMLLPLCRSLLRILSLQLIQASHLFKSPSRESHSIAAKLVPILVTILSSSIYVTLSPSLALSHRLFWSSLCPRALSLVSSSSL